MSWIKFLVTIWPILKQLYLLWKSTPYPVDRKAALDKVSEACVGELCKVKKN